MGGSGETAVTVKGGVFHAGSDAVCVSQTGVATVLGGTFDAPFGADARMGATIRVLGGDFSAAQSLFYCYTDSTVAPEAGVPEGYTGDTPDALVLPTTYCLFTFCEAGVVTTPVFHFAVTPVTLDGLAWYDTEEHAAADVGAYIGTFGEDGCQYFSSLAGAVEAAEAGDTITIYKTHAVTGAIEIAKSLTLTGTGVTVSGPVGQYLLSVTGDCTLTVTGSLTLQGDNRTVSITGGSVNFTLQDDASLVSVNNSAIVMASSGDVTVNVTSTGTVSAKTYALFYNGTGAQIANISGGTLSALSKTVYFNTAGTLTLSGTGALVHETNDAILVAKAIADDALTTVNLNGGSISAGRYAIYAQNKFKLNITGGKFTSGSVFYDEWYNAAATDGDYQVPVSTEITMTGGSIEAGSTVFRFITPDATVSISGDAAIHTTAGSFAYAADTAKNLTVSISGEPQILVYAYGIYLDGDGALTVNITGGYLRTITNGAIFVTNAASATVNVRDAFLYTAQNKAEENTTACIGIMESVTEAHVTVSGTAHLFGQNSCLKLLTAGTVEFTGDNVWLEAGYQTVYLVSDDTVSLTIEGGNFTSLQDHALVVTPADGSSVVNIYGGRFVNKNTDTRSHGASITRCAAAKINRAALNIWGGTFYGVGTTAIDILDGANGNIYGGVFRYNPEIHYETYGATARIGSDATLTVWGGTFISEDDAAPIFRFATGKTLDLKGFNCTGGNAIVAGGLADLAYPDDTHTYAKNAISMNAGAQVRMVAGSTGLRFISSMSADAVAYLKEIGAVSISYGTLILPAAELRDLAAVTRADLVRANTLFADIPANFGLIGNDDDGYAIRAALVNIKKYNYNRDFAAVAYVTYTLEGHTVTWYTPYEQADNARTVAVVATAALADGTYSPAQTAVLETFANAYKAPVDLTDPAMQDKNILFVGNSMIYINDTYQTIERLIRSAGYRATVTELYHDSYSFGNWMGQIKDTPTETQYDDAPTYAAKLRDALENNQYDIIVINTKRRALVNDDSVTTEPLQQLVDLIREKQGDDCQIVIYATPPVPKVRDGLTTDEQLVRAEELYTMISETFDLPCIFVTEVLYTMYVSFPEFTFMRADASHMNEYGSYAVACALVAGLYNVNPVGLYNGMIDDAETVSYLQNLAAGVRVFTGE